MEYKKSIGIGFRGTLLLIYQAIAFLTFMVFTNYPLNILADMYGGAGTISMLYTAGMLVGIVIQLVIVRFIGKVKSIKSLSIILGIVTLALALAIMLISPEQQAFWQICYFLLCVVSTLYAMLTIGILVGQWFPRRKGTIMGIATFAFPVGNGLIGLFAGSVFAKGFPDVFGAFLPFFIVAVIGLLVGAIFIKDYPEQVGAYRDNDKGLTPEIAKQMMEQEIQAKKNSVWTLSNTLKSRDFWFATLPMGFLLMCSVGLMTQTAAILGVYAQELEPLGGFAGVMGMIAIVACVGSWLLGVLDTKFGTKTAILISVLIMVVSGVMGAIPSMPTLLISLILLALFMGASSNFTVSGAAQYWRREDFGNVFACVNPIANVLQCVGPMVVAMLLGMAGPSVVFGVIAGLGALGTICILLFKPSHVKETDDKYRKAAGLPLDDALVGRK